MKARGAARVPRGYALTTEARALQCRRAGLRVVVVNPVGPYVPEWAAQAPDGTTTKMLRAAKRDPAAREALTAAGRIAPLRPRLVSNFTVQAEASARMLNDSAAGLAGVHEWLTRGDDK